MKNSFSIIELEDLLDYLVRVGDQLKGTSLYVEGQSWRQHIANYLNGEHTHPTEQAYPEQTKRFREILDEMYQTHLIKNADYSPYNILVTGMKGCITRLWDKSARFFNLMGIDIIKMTWDEEKMNSVKDEPIEQTLLDWANYCVITRILREGKWGK